MQKDFSYIYIYIRYRTVCKTFTNIQNRDQVPINQYSAVYTVYTVNKQYSKGENTKTPHSLSLAGSEPVVRHIGWLDKTGVYPDASSIGPVPVHLHIYMSSELKPSE